MIELVKDVFFFSHKEITVLYVPNLPDCLPSLDEWRDQWVKSVYIFMSQ